MISSRKRGPKLLSTLATEPKLETKTGRYFIKMQKIAGIIEKAENFTARNRLWNISEELIGIKTEINV